MNRPVVGYVLAAIALAVLALTFGSFFSPLENTSFGVALAPDGSNARVTAVAPGSGAAKAGLHPGDVIDLGSLTLSDRYRLQIGRSPLGTPVTLAVIAPAARHTIVLQAEPRTEPLPPDFIAGTLINATITLLIVALAVARRPSLATAALVLYGMGTPQSFLFSGQFTWIPNPLFGAVAVFVNLTVAFLPLFALLPFIARFPEAPATPEARRTARVADGLFWLAAAFFTIEAIYEPLQFLSWSIVYTLETYASIALVVVFTAIAYRRTAGEQRRRVGWVLAGLIVTAIGYVVFEVFDVSQLLRTSTSPLVLDAATVMGTALPIALGYAILRHRVLDIGFALNRTMVYGAMTLMVVIVVSLVDWLTTRVLAGERLALAVEALITIGFGLTLNWLHGRTERLIDRIVFRARHLAEKRIEYRIGALDFAASAAFVDEAVAVEAPRILELSSAAVFRRSAESEPFLCTIATGWGDRDAVEIGDGSLLVSTLRSLERPLILDDVAIHDDRFPPGPARPAIAIPIVSQHDLIGFALFGNRSDGALPDPEEIALLARLCRAAGSGYAIVEARRWREHAASLERSMAALTAPA